MLTTWKNTGAPFTMADGRRVERNATFDASASDQDVKMRRHKLVPMRPGTPTTVPSDDAEREALFPGVDFGSDRAYEVARDAEPVVTVDEIDEYGEGEGDDGALLVGDVRAIIEARG